MALASSNMLPTKPTCLGSRSYNVTKAVSREMTK